MFRNAGIAKFVRVMMLAPFLTILSAYLAKNILTCVEYLVRRSRIPRCTVSANVQFQGKQSIKVRYVLTYRDGMLINETWQIDPKLAIAAAN